MVSYLNQPRYLKQRIRRGGSQPGFPPSPMADNMIIWDSHLWSGCLFEMGIYLTNQASLEHSCYKKEKKKTARAYTTHSHCTFSLIVVFIIFNTFSVHQFCQRLPFYRPLSTFTFNIIITNKNGFWVHNITVYFFILHVTFTFSSLLYFGLLFYHPTFLLSFCLLYIILILF